MNQIIKEMIERKSVRQFRDQPIAQSEKEWILKAALNGPTAGNMNLFSIIEVNDRSMKETLAIQCDHQPFIATAPYVLVFNADYAKWETMFKKYASHPISLAESDLILAMNDAMIAAQNAVNAAWSLGIGSCYIGDILENYEENKILFHLPDHVVPVVMVVFGYPTDSQINRKKPERFEQDLMVYENTYASRDIEKAFQTQSHKEDISKYIEAFAKRKFYAEFRAEMNRSVKSMLEDWKGE